MGRIAPVRFSDAEKKRKRGSSNNKVKMKDSHARLEAAMKKNPDWRIERGRRLLLT